MNRKAGFTLVEMLVVMVLLGLISSILFQGLDLIGKIQERLIPKIQQQQENALQVRWFRGTVSGLIAGIETADSFIGTTKQFSGLSVSPLHAPFDSPAMVSWVISRQQNFQQLNYLQSTHLNWNIESAKAATDDIKFSYLDQQGHWQEGWNLRSSPQDQLALPEAIAMIKTIDGKEHWWLASVQGEKKPSWWVKYDRD